MMLIGSVYRHFKGNLYRVVHLAVHTETGECLVIYTRADVEKAEVWARPYADFHGMHESGVKRFVKVEEE